MTTLPQTLQEAFDAVAIHLLINQRKQCTNGYNCLYRGPENTKCAFGIFIPDEFYHPEFERQLATNVREMLKEAGMPIPDWMYAINDWRDFISQIQYAHDNVAYFSNFKEPLIDIAQQFNLNTDVLNGREEYQPVFMAPVNVLL